MSFRRVLGSVVVILASCLATTSGLAAKKELVEPPRDPETDKFTYQGVVEVEGVDAHDLYKRAKTWLANAYESANTSIQLDDAEAGRLIVKGKFLISWMAAEWSGNTNELKHTLTIEVKDGRYRYRLTDFVGVIPPHKGMLGEVDERELALEVMTPLNQFGTKARRNACAPSEALIKSLEAGMRRSSPVGTDNW